MLAEVEYRVSALAREDALDAELGIERGRVFADLAALDAWVAGIERSVRNNRLFDPASIVYWEPLDSSDEAGRSKVRLVADLALSWNALAVPIPKYSDDTGFVVAVRYKDFNFLGSLKPLSINLDWFVADGAAKLVADGVLPFDLAGGVWSYGFSFDAWYDANSGLRGTVKNTLSGAWAFDAQQFERNIERGAVVEADTELLGFALEDEIGGPGARAGPHLARRDHRGKDRGGLGPDLESRQ